MTLAQMIYELKHEANILQNHLDYNLVKEMDRIRINDRLDVIRQRIRELDELPTEKMIEEYETTYLEIPSKINNGKIK